MINRAAITQWNKIVPWNDNAQVEQDLIIGTVVKFRHYESIGRLSL